MMGVALYLIGILMMGGGLYRIYGNHPRFRHAMIAVAGFWLMLIGVLVW